MITNLRSITPLEVNAVAGNTTEDFPPRTLDKRLVHKSYDENVLVSHIEAVRGPNKFEKGDNAGAMDRTDHFRGVLCVHHNHPFFFERGSGHVPALYLFEAIRQMSSAVAHMFYNVPIEAEVVVTESSAQFRNMATLDDPIIAEKTLSKHVYRKGRLIRMNMSVIIRQVAVEIARMSSNLVLLTKQQLSYLEQRGGEDGCAANAKNETTGANVILGPHRCKETRF
jgi:A-factor biosynthesis hotdog domain